MLDLTHVDQQVRKIHDEVVHEYEQKLTRQKESRERSAKLQGEHQEQLRGIMRASQMDLDAIDRFEEAGKAASQKFLDETRPHLLNRPSHESKDAKKLAIQSSLQIPDWITTRVYGATLLSSNQDYLKKNPGEHGNPWIMPTDPRKVHLNPSMGGGGGWGCGWRGLGVNESGVAVFYFPFAPSKDAIWYLLGLVNLHGFYTLVADDQWWNCKKACVSVVASMDVYQYFSNGTKNFSLLSMCEQNIATSSLWDYYLQMDYQVWLRANHLTIVTVSIYLDAFAQGDGSYSELNFSDGATHYIEPLIVAARPL